MLSTMHENTMHFVTVQCALSNSTDPKQPVHFKYRGVNFSPGMITVKLSIISFLEMEEQGVEKRMTGMNCLVFKNTICCSAASLCCDYDTPKICCLCLCCLCSQRWSLNQFVVCGCSPDSLTFLLLPYCTALCSLIGIHTHTQAPLIKH